MATGNPAVAPTSAPMLPPIEYPETPIWYRSLKWLSSARPSVTAPSPIRAKSATV